MRRAIIIQGLLVASVLSVSMLAARAGYDGEDVYKKTCGNCHHYGVSGAPVFGDSAAWQPRIEQGKDVLYRHALRGFKSMPAKGANPKLSDSEVRLAVDYMIERAGSQSAK